MTAPDVENTFTPCLAALDTAVGGRALIPGRSLAIAWQVASALDNGQTVDVELFRQACAEATRTIHSDDER